MDGRHARLLTCTLLAHKVCGHLTNNDIVVLLVSTDIGSNIEQYLVGIIEGQLNSDRLAE